MVLLNTLRVSPPLLNTSCAWASDFNELADLYHCPYTGAVTVRTTTMNGFKEDESHTVAFTRHSLSSINSYGYSPHSLAQYISWIKELLCSPKATSEAKPFIISIAPSSAEEAQILVDMIQSLRTEIQDQSASYCRIGIELNTSCPNIPGSPPKGYVLNADDTMRSILQVLADAFTQDKTLTIGLKLPPYLYRDQFVSVLELLRKLVSPNEGGRDRCPISFLTCTNTLGNSLLFCEQVMTAGMGEFAVPTALGGLAGEAIHALALGNVFTFSELLKAYEPESGMTSLSIIGVGGVTTKEAAERMRKAGAAVVGCATLLGREGTKAFEILSNSTSAID